MQYLLKYSFDIYYIYCRVVILAASKVVLIHSYSVKRIKKERERERGDR
jgi:hypothetical protein